MSRFRWQPALLALIGGLLIAGLGAWRLAAFRRKAVQVEVRAIAVRHQILARILGQLQATSPQDAPGIQEAVATFTQPNSPLLYAVMTDQSGKAETMLVNRYQVAQHMANPLPTDPKAMMQVLSRLGETHDMERYSVRLPNGHHVKTAFVKATGPSLSWWWLVLATGLVLALAAAVGFLRPCEDSSTWIALSRALQERRPNQSVAQTLADTAQQAASVLRSDAKMIAQLKRHLPEQILSKLLAGSSPGGDERAVTVITVRLDDISELYDTLAMNRVIDLVNTYLDVVVETMHKHQAVLGTVGPDGVKAWWGAPDDIVDPEVVASQAALELRRAVFELNRVRQATTQQVLHVHVGLATGRAVLAKVGSSRRMSYVLLGLVSQRASAFAAIAERDEILICDQTARLAESHGFRLECLSSPGTGPGAGRVHKLLASS